jgi:D-alanyl-lipoteichoic acid acyltransferase DltB (MBOAT superfamily)
VQRTIERFHPLPTHWKGTPAADVPPFSWIVALVDATHYSFAAPLQNPEISRATPIAPLRNVYGLFAVTDLADIQLRSLLEFCPVIISWHLVYLLCHRLCVTRVARDSASFISKGANSLVSSRAIRFQFVFGVLSSVALHGIVGSAALMSLLCGNWWLWRKFVLPQGQTSDDVATAAQYYSRGGDCTNVKQPRAAKPFAGPSQGQTIALFAFVTVQLIVTEFYWESHVLKPTFGSRTPLWATGLLTWRAIFPLHCLRLVSFLYDAAYAHKVHVVAAAVAAAADNPNTVHPNDAKPAAGPAVASDGKPDTKLATPKIHLKDSIYDELTKARVQESQPVAAYTTAALLGYTFYAPLHVAGPIVTFNAFCSYLRAPCHAAHSAQSDPRVAAAVASSVCRDASDNPCGRDAADASSTLARGQSLIIPPAWTASMIRAYAWAVLRAWLCVYVFIRTSQAATAMRCMAYEPHLVTLRDGIAIMYLAVAFLWIKFVAVWKYARLVALVDGLDAPEDMLGCFADIISAGEFWRRWHASFNLWIVRYMYVPLGGAASRRWAVYPIFLFVALWHDVTVHLLAWALMMAFAVSMEAFYHAKSRAARDFDTVVARIASCNSAAFAPARPSNHPPLQIAAHTGGVCSSISITAGGQPNVGGRVVGSSFCAHASAIAAPVAPWHRYPMAMFSVMNLTAANAFGFGVGLMAILRAVCPSLVVSQAQAAFEARQLQALWAFAPYRLAGYVPDFENESVTLTVIAVLSYFFTVSVIAIWSREQAVSRAMRVTSSPMGAARTA